MPRLQFLGGRDIGEDHEFLDQAVAVEAMPRHDRDRPPRFIEHHAVLGQIQLQRTPRAPRPVERGESAVECIEAFARDRHQRARRVIVRRLHRLVGQPRPRTHQCPLETMPLFTTGRIDPQMRGDTGAVFVRSQ